MKYMVFALMFVAGLQASAQETTEKKDETKEEGLVFTQMEIVRENIPYGTDDTFVFEFKNTAKTPAIIQGVQTSCGCTTAAKPEEPVKPGKKSEISVKYDTKRAGAINKSVTINSNAVNEPVKVVRIKGTVEPDPNAPAPTGAPGGAPVKEQGGAPNN